MAHTLEFFGALCETAEFKVNGIEASWGDFGSKYDQDPENAEDYGCGDMVFEPCEPKPEVLVKYKIDELEYWSIANALREGLSFGTCGWCV